MRANDGIGKPCASYLGAFCSTCGTRRVNAAFYCFNPNTGEAEYVAQCPRCGCSKNHAFGEPVYKGFWKGYLVKCGVCGKEEESFAKGF